MSLDSDFAKILQQRTFLQLCNEIEMKTSGAGDISCLQQIAEARAEFYRWMSLTDEGERQTCSSTLQGMWNLLLELATQKDVTFSPLPGSELNKQNNPLKRKENCFNVASKNARLNKFNEKRAFDLSTSNMFDPLTSLIENNEDEMDAETTSDNSKSNVSSKLTPPKTKTKIEPITIKKTEAYYDLINHIETNLIKKVTRKILKGDTIKIFPESIDDYRSIQKYLTDNAIEHFRMAPRNERPKKVLLRGIPPETQVEIVKNELVKKSFNINRVSQLRDYKTKLPLPLFLVDIFPTDNFRDIYEIDLFLGYYIKVETYRSNGPKQCWNCQRFNHSSDVCAFNPVCMKCAGSHKTRECPPENTIIKCANCGESHTANYGGCKFNPRNLKNNKIITIRNSQNAFRSNIVKPQSSFSKITSGASQTSQTSNEPTVEAPPAPNLQNFPPLTPNSNLNLNDKPPIPSVDKLDIIIQKLEKIYELLNKINNLPNAELAAIFAAHMTGENSANVSNNKP